jgi:hypothetical protein
MTKLFGFTLDDSSAVILFFFSALAFLMGCFLYYYAWQYYTHFTDILSIPFYDFYSPLYSSTMSEYRRYAWAYFLIASGICTISGYTFYKTIKQQKSRK